MVVDSIFNKLVCLMIDHLLDRKFTSLSSLSPVSALTHFALTNYWDELSSGASDET